MCVWFAVLNMVGQGRLVDCQLSKDLKDTRSESLSGAPRDQEYSTGKGWKQRRVKALRLECGCSLDSENGLPWWLRRSRIFLKCRRSGFDPWVRKIP